MTTSPPRQSAPASAAVADPTERAERTSACWLALLFIVATAYFFQGGGWNQNARYDTVRALVERHTFAITDYAWNTGDVARIDGRVYANKPPGVPLLAAPIYFVLYHAELALHKNADDWRVINFNAHVLAFFTGGIPVVLLVLAMRRYARQHRRNVAAAWALAAALGAGTLLWPYSGIILAHNLTAYCLFEAWMLLRGRPVPAPAPGSDSGPTARPGPPTAPAALLAGVLLGLALSADYLVAPALALLILGTAWGAHRDGQWRPRLWLLAGPLAAAALLALFQRLAFGHWLDTSYTHEAAQFRQNDLFLGLFGPPQWRRLYWLTIHPFRGLFFCCPVLAIAPLAFVRRAGAIDRLRAFLLPLLIALSFLAFNLTFNGWTGGWFVGPRYLVPAIPFLFVLVVNAYDGWRRWIFWPAMLLSVVIMLATTAVTPQMPAPNSGPPPALGSPLANPVAQVLSRLWAGKLHIYPYAIVTPAESQAFRQWNPNAPAARWATYNLGELLGLPGLWSLLPLGLVAAAAIAGTWHACRTRRAAMGK